MIQKAKSLLGSLQIVLIGLAGTILAGCATGPATARHVSVKTGERFAVGYTGSDFSFTLANSSGFTAADAERELSNDPSLRIIPDKDLQATLDILGGQEFFRYAGSRPTPGSQKQLIVVAAGRRFVLSDRFEGPNKEENALAARAYVASFNALLAAHQSHQHFTKSKFTADDFKKANQDLNSGSKRHP